MPDTCTDCFLFPELFHKPLHVKFSDQRLSSDGGLLLLKARDRKMNLCPRLADAILDRRDAAKVEHSLLSQLQQRIFALAAGYADTNQAAALANDPMFKLACGRSLDDSALASQPTLSRFENTASASDLYRMSSAFIDALLALLQKRHRAPRRIWMDVDPTCTPTYGAQQLTLFNGYYDTWCYLPLVFTISFDADPRKYPLVLLLRPGNADAMQGVLPVLRRLIPRLKTLWRKSHLWLRADSAFARSDLLDWLDQQRIGYDIGVASNGVLAREMKEALEVVRELATRDQETVTFYLDTLYRAKRWSRPRRVLCKVEVVHALEKAPRDNVRYLVTTGTSSPKHGFGRYYGHSDMENSIKELKHDAALGRFSCSRASANQFRAILSLVALTLVQGLASSWKGGELRSQMDTLRTCLLKVAVRVKETARRIVIELAEDYPWKHRFRRCALGLGAVPI
ncbi:MAG: IS1380 family transposase [Kiritimatiellae bacterium]|nr:IS1380 family transposase [Kiritimatiellia bacterium]